DDRIKKITCSHIGSNVETMEKVTKGEINIHFVPQGSLCEKVRAGGAGIGGILTPTGVHTPMEEGKQLLEWDDEKGEYKFVKADEPQKGKRFILELPLHADVALIHAYKADKMGNVMYNHTARNFNEVFATAADFVIVEAEHIVEVGEIGPNEVMTPGALVDLIVQAKTEV
ncbi:MAG: 3-oxoacid CoA-transferase subunit A, partial [Lachnospiraceae bacterium]|nr:3-oxoacid CoA-transferase subunit A [Lachnospiraceae bacterium]